MANASQALSNFKGDYLSAKMLGVIPDGVTDNYHNLSTAISVASSAKSPVLYFPVGTYRVVVPVNGFVSVPAGLQLIGSQGSTILFVDDGNVGSRCLFQFNGSNSGLRTITVNAQISVAPAGQNGVDILQIGNADNITLEDVVLNGSRDSGFQNTNGLQIIGNSNGVRISGGVWEQLWYGFYKASSNTNKQQNFRVSGVKFYRNFGDDANFNSPGNNFGESDITVTNCNFSDNQSNTPTGGFGFSAANCMAVTLSGCTFDNYQREAVHIELTEFVTIGGGCTFKNVGLTDFSAIQIISASKKVTLAGITIDAENNTNSTFGIAVQPGGGSPCERVSVSGTTVSVSSAVAAAVYVNSTNHLVCTGVVAMGPGTVSGGIYTGGSNTGIDIGGVSKAVVVGCDIAGFGFGIGSSSTTEQIGDLAIVGKNTISDCNVGLAIKANGDMTAAFNLMNNCVSPTQTGATTVTPKTLSFIGNRAVGCVNRIDVYDNSHPFHWNIALNMDDVSGSTIGSLSVLSGYGNFSNFPGDLIIGAGAPSGPAAASIAWGQGTGFQLQFGTVVSGAFSPLLYIDDLGNIIHVGGQGRISFIDGEFTTWVGAGVTAPLGSESLTTGTGGAVIQGPLALPNVVTTLPLFDTGPGNTIQGDLIQLGAHVSGILPVGNGGTGQVVFADGFIDSVSHVFGSVPFGATGSFNAFVSGSFFSQTVVTSIDFTAQTYTTVNLTGLTSLTTNTHTYSQGLITS